MASETLLDLLESYVLAVNNAQFGIAYPGRSNGVGGYEIEVVNDPGRWWIRVWLNGQYSSIGKAIPLGVPRDPQQRCRTLVINGELCLMSPDPTALRLLYGNYANTAATGNTPTAVEGGDKNALGTVQPSPAGGMNVSISAYPAGGLYTFINAVDLTGDEPGSAGEFLWDVAYIDTDGTVKWAQSSPVTTTDPTALLPSQAKAVTIPAGAFRLYAVSLANGQTDIQKSRFINFQDDFAPEAVVAIDTSAASIGDVATWNGTEWEADPPSGGSVTLSPLRTKLTSVLTTTSATLTPIDSTNMGFSQHGGYTLAVGDMVECILTGEMYINTGAPYGDVDIEVDQPTSSNVYVSAASSSGVPSWRRLMDGNRNVATIVITFVATEAGTHAFRPVWRTSSNTLSMDGADVPTYFTTKKLAV